MYRSNKTKTTHFSNVTFNKCLVIFRYPVSCICKLSVYFSEFCGKRTNRFYNTLRIIGPSKLPILRTLTLRHTGSGPLPLESPRSLGYNNLMTSCSSTSWVSESHPFFLGESVTENNLLLDGWFRNPKHPSSVWM